MFKKFPYALSVCLFLICIRTDALEVSSIHQILLKNRLSPDHLGIIISDETKEVFSLNPSRKFKPASVSKVVTGAAVLELLGTRFRFRTQILYDGTILDNTIRGTMYLRGGGDPSFHSGKLPTLLAGLKKLKIKMIEGDLVVDDSRFLDVITPEWQSQIPTLNPQMFPLFVRLDPVPQGTPFSQQQKPERIHRKLTNLEGRFVVYQNQVEPDLATAKQFLEMMQKSGIQLQGKIKRGKVSQSARVLTEVVSSSTKVISHMLKSSNNFYADLLVRNIPVAFGERPGTYATGMDFITFYLDHVKIPRSQYSLNSGSGFSHQNVISPRALIQLLTHLKNEKTVSSTFLSALPVAGVDGTLRNRMRNTSPKGRVRAKTGYLRPVATKTHHLDGAVSLAGYATSLKGKDYTFVFLYNGPAGPEVVKSAFDNICAEIVGPLPPQPKKKITSRAKKKVPAKRSKRSRKTAVPSKESGADVPPGVVPPV